MYDNLPYCLHESWAAEGLPGMSPEQEREECRVDSMLDKAADMILRPERYTESDICGMLDDLYAEQRFTNYNWSYDLQDRMTITINALEEV